MCIRDRASVTVNGKSYNVAIVDGKGTLVVSNLAAGYYTVVAKFAENDMYLACLLYTSRCV